MQLGKHMEITAGLKRQLAETLAERDAGRRVIAELTDQLAEAHRLRALDNVASYARIEVLTGERDEAVEQYAEAEAAHRVALADIAETDAELAVLRERIAVVDGANRPDPHRDMDRCG